MSSQNKKHLVVLSCIFFFGLISAALAGENQFSCKLAANMVGPKPAVTDATGIATFQLDESKQELSFKLEVEKISEVYMAHIHVGPDNEQGPIAVWLYPITESHMGESRCIQGEFSGTLAEGVIRPEDLREGVTFDDLIDAMRSGKAYVNSHTKKYMPGEIRGQIHTGSL